MSEKPILFSGPMVRAILDGRKTQTRRIIKPNPDIAGHFHDWTPDRKDLWPRWAPYHAGDHLWVRETHMIESNRHVDDESAYPPPFSDGRPINRMPAVEDVHDAYWQQCHYAATDPKPELVNLDTEEALGWRPSIHMPRWASRITLEVVSVKVERLQDISPEDVRSEGLDVNLSPRHIEEAKPAFKRLWESINGEGSWDANPWVWVVEFKVIP